MVINKQKALLCLFCLMIISIACNTIWEKRQFDSSEFSSMIDTYFYYYGEYPSSLDSFLDFYKNQDSINATIKYLSERKYGINWSLNNKTVLEEELLVEEKGDTLFWHSSKKHLSYLDDLINSYEVDYLEYPESLDDLINYDQATKGMKDESFERCIAATLSYLEMFNDQLTWQKNDSLFLLTTNTDTISCRIGPSRGVSICWSDNLREKSVFLFFDKYGTAVINDDLLTSFKRGLQEIRKKYKDEQFNVSDYHIIQYFTSSGLSPFCEEDTIALDIEWFRDVEPYLERFTSENELEKVIFVSAPYKL